MTENLTSAMVGSNRMFVDEGRHNRLVVNETEYDDEDEEAHEDEESEDETQSEFRRKDHVIKRLTNKKKTLEKTVEEMRSMTRTVRVSHDKTGWTGEEMNFVKSINDFCKEKLYPKEKFLRKN